ncbi:amino-acid N-acetyltransferase [Marisediminicola senii]|uniref:amino-acid N-acetyltransferase n=1 Tax=Marisediminicola senii TaxID=2711233 RepID=UPI001F15BC66|nr:amino-acid N-acetyltransferase [Marisediminicola senii]
MRGPRTSDVPHIQRLIGPLVNRGILLGKESVVFYEAIREFRIAQNDMGVPVGCGALHVMWQDLGEIRTLAVDPEWMHRGVGHSILERLEADALELGLTRLFCLTFEVDFFEKHGYSVMGEEPIDPALYSELLRSPDEGVAEFLDLARVKPNTLGNTRMIKHLSLA